MEAWLSLAKVSIQQQDWQWANMAYRIAMNYFVYDLTH